MTEDLFDESSIRAAADEVARDRGYEPDWLNDRAARGGPDHDDMVSLWPRCSFASAEDAAIRFAAAYPHVRTDSHLGAYIGEIENQAAIG